MEQKISIRWKYLWPYLVFGGTIAAAVIINVRLTMDGFIETRHHARIINLAGRQRYLSQKNLTAFLTAVHKINPSLPDTGDLYHWKQMHKILQQGSVENDLFIMPSSATAAMHDMDSVCADLYEILHMPVSSVSDADVQTAIALQSVYLPAMDNGVYLFQQNAESTLWVIRKKQIWAAVMSGLVLMMEIIFLIIPYHRKLILAYRQLKHNKQTIEEQSEEIQQQMHSLSENHIELEKLNHAKELTLEGINAGVWHWNIITGEESWSPNFYRVLGYEVGEIPSNFDTFLNFLLHPDDKESVQTAVEKHLKYGDRYHVEIRMRNKDGSYRWYDAAGESDRDISGNATQMAGSIIDINDKILNHKKLEAANEAKSKILAILSHDLRSPLNGIKGMLELQSLGGLTQEEFIEYMGRLEEGIDFTIKTLDNILIWASSQMDEISVKPVDIKLSVALQEVEKFHQHFAVQKGVEVTYTAADSTVGHADPNHIFIILRNLVSNAIKFTPSGGKVTVTAHAHDGQVFIDVADNGVGMNADFVRKLMNQEERLSSYGTNGEKGTGLGINLVMDLLKRNGGKLRLESELGKGSTFTCIIPGGNTV